jgi:hypothetical protein
LNVSHISQTTAFSMLAIENVEGACPALNLAVRACTHKSGDGRLTVRYAPIAARKRTSRDFRVVPQADNQTNSSNSSGRAWARLFVPLPHEGDLPPRSRRSAGDLARPLRRRPRRGDRGASLESLTPSPSRLFDSSGAYPTLAGQERDEDRLPAQELEHFELEEHGTAQV